jgi:hypothetical protein
MHASLDTLPCNHAFLEPRIIGHASFKADFGDFGSQRSAYPGTRNEAQFGQLAQRTSGPIRRNPFGASPNNLGYTGELMQHDLWRSDRPRYSGELMRHDSEAVPRWDNRDKLSFFHFSLLYFVISCFITSVTLIYSAILLIRRSFMKHRNFYHPFLPLGTYSILRMFA